MTSSTTDAATRRYPRPAHHPPDPAVPEPGLGGLRPARPVQQRRPLGGRPAERRQYRRRQGGRRQHRDRDRQDRSGRHRLQRRGVDQVDPGQRGDDGHPGQHHREPRRGHRGVDGFGRLAAGTQFLAETHQDEQRIVDGERDPEHRHRRGHEHRHGGVRRQQVDQAHGDHDRADAEGQRDRRGGQRTEHRQQDDQDDRQVPAVRRRRCRAWCSPPRRRSVRPAR